MKIKISAYDLVIYDNKKMNWHKTMMTKLITVSTLVFFAFVTTAQENKKVVVPAEVTEAFDMLYPDVKDLHWDSVGEFFEACFRQGEKFVSFLFDKKGNLQKVKNEVMEGELPIEIKDLIAKDCPDRKVQKAVRIDINGTITHEVEMENGEQTMVLKFNAKGELVEKFIR